MFLKKLLKPNKNLIFQRENQELGPIQNRDRELRTTRMDHFQVIFTYIFVSFHCHAKLRCWCIWPQAFQLLSMTDLTHKIDAWNQSIIIIDFLNFYSTAHIGGL